MSSSTFTHTKTCTVPRSSRLLSSSFRPFYPRSQQQLYHQHSGYMGTDDGSFQVPVQHSDDIDAGQSHFSSWSHVRDSKFYDQQYYASLGAEPYEVPWVPNSAWIGSAWQQWGDAVEYAYAEDDTGDSANLFSDSLSYYAGSPALEQDISACAASNTTCGPLLFPDKTTQFLNGHANESSEVAFKTSSSITGIIPKQVSSASEKLKESSLSSFRESNAKAVLGYGQGPAKSERKEVASTFTGTKLDADCSPYQVSTQMNSGFASQAGECESTTYLAENVGVQKEGNALVKASYNLSKEHLSAAATSDTIKFTDNLNCKSSTVALATDVIQEEVRSQESVSQHTSMQSTNEICESITLPKDVQSQALERINGFEGSRQEQTISSLIQPEDAGLSTNGPHLLVECIYNLAKVLLSSQSKTSKNALSSSDCFVLENTICMLSQRLFQSSAIEANFCQDPNNQQDLKNLSDPTKGLLKDFDHFASLKHIISLKRDSQIEVLQNAPKLTASGHVGGDDQNSSYKKYMEVVEEQLRTLRSEIQKLQEEVVYERVESNATVSLYKNLWSDAEEALKVSKSEIREIRTELAVLKQELTILKHWGSVGVAGTHRECELTNVESSTFKQDALQEDLNKSRAVASDLSKRLAEVMHKATGMRLKKDSEVLTGYFDSGMSPNCKRTGTPHTKFEQADSNHSSEATPSDYSSTNSELSTSKSYSKYTVPPSTNLDGDVVRRLSMLLSRQGLDLNKNPELSTSKSYPKHTVPPPANLDGDVARRLSLLLSRQGLDLNKTCTESSVEWPSESSIILEPSSSEAISLNENYLVWSEASYLVNDNKGLGCPISNLRSHVSEAEDGLYAFKEELIDGGMDVAELNDGICHEEDMEIICFKPGIGDSNFTCLKGEPEWEDVVVTALHDEKSAGKEMV